LRSPQAAPSQDRPRYSPASRLAWAGPSRRPGYSASTGGGPPLLCLAIVLVDQASNAVQPAGTFVVNTGGSAILPSALGDALWRSQTFGGLRHGRHRPAGGRARHRRPAGKHRPTSGGHRRPSRPPLQPRRPVGRSIPVSRPACLAARPNFAWQHDPRPAGSAPRPPTERRHGGLLPPTANHPPTAAHPRLRPDNDTRQPRPPHKSR
jgi:hypothetical protein